MAERLYGVDEIMRMRAAAATIGRYSPAPVTPEGVEAQLRTYMANSTDPADLEAAAARLEAGGG